MKNPFDVLAIAETADDEAIKKAYLQKVREYPPEHEPERFQAVRAAFEAIKTRRDRLRYRLFQQDPPDLEDLVEAALRTGSGGRPSEAQFKELLMESLTRRASVAQ